MSPTGDLSTNSALVFSRLSLPELSILVDNLAIELARRGVVGQAALALASRAIRSHHARELAAPSAIFSADCSNTPPP